MREELADRFCSHLAECRKAWKAAGMTVAEQKEAEETEISLILEKMESEEKAEETQLLSSSEMQNYVDTVCDQIRWKQTRKAVAEELTDHLLLQKEAFQSFRQKGFFQTICFYRKKPFWRKDCRRKQRKNALWRKWVTALR